VLALTKVRPSNGCGGSGERRAGGVYGLEEGGRPGRYAYRRDATHMGGIYGVARALDRPLRLRCEGGMRPDRGRAGDNRHPESCTLAISSGGRASCVALALHAPRRACRLHPTGLLPNQWSHDAYAQEVAWRDRTRLETCFAGPVASIGAAIAAPACISKDLACDRPARASVES
jgi:hypothetical protein